jgi:hypothetical protein
MRSKSVVLGDVSFVCPVTGKRCSVGATVRLKPVPIMQMPVDTDMTRYAAMNDDQLDAVNQKMAEAERHG